MAGTYNNLMLSNTSGAQGLNGVITVNGTLTTSAEGTFNIDANKYVTVNGTLTNLAANGLVVKSGGSLIQNSENVRAITSCHRRLRFSPSVHSLPVYKAGLSISMHGGS